ncbi:MAG: M1 family metallopeptidase [Cyanobacteria bacterium SZAS LIN-3]|nr:M1 family metallopeptidase [Cyanobacteria bacterium SZAS LIN-3]
MAASFSIRKSYAKTFLSVSLALVTSAGLALPGPAASARAKAAAPEVVSYQRLPKVAVPERYDLYFEPNFESQDFEGSETVYINVTEATKEITLNSLDLSIYEASIARNEKTHGDWIKAEIERNKDREIVVFKFAKTLTPGPYELSLKFNGKFSDKMCGFYLSTFKDKDGKEQKMASTQMEPTDARRMFPCFDEPVYKATYRVTAAIPTDMVAISNAAVQFEKIDQRKDKKVVSFEESPKMSSYLFALVIGHLKPSQAVTVNGKEIRVWCTEGKENLTSFALNSAARFMAYYEDYFGVPYPLKKLDLIGVPDFAHGAMENIGAVTFRETALLVDEKNSSTHAKMRVADVVAHEMAHLWFGDLVTMAWWNDLWLNEAFATWMSDKAVNNLKPEWRLWDDFAVDRGSTLSSDSISATRAVQCVVNSPNDALEMFDEITYGKGAALMRMLEMYLSEETFQKGIQAYMKKHSFGNATTEDLWNALSAATKSTVDVSALMHAWVHTPGCPLVSFAPAGEKKHAKGGPSSSYNFNQERFMLLDQPIKKGAAAREKPQTWQIPMVLKGESGQERYLLTEPGAKVTFSGFKPVFINALGNGFYRSKYDQAQLSKLAEAVKADPNFLTPAERISLVSDLWALSYSGRISIDDYLAFTANFSGDSDPYLQSLMVGQLHQLETVIGDEMRPGFETLVRNRLNPVLERLTMSKRPDDSDLINSLRGEIISTLGTIGGDKKIIDYCRGQFETYLNDDKSLDGNLLSAIVDVVAYNGGEEEFNRIQNAFTESTEPQARQRNLGALSCFREKDLIERALGYSLSKEVRAQDVTTVVGSLLSSSASKSLAWAFVKAHWSEFNAKLSDDQMPKLIDAVSNFSSLADRDDVSSFIASHPLPAGRRRVAKTLEFIAIRTQFKDKQSTSLASFLKKLELAQAPH